MTRHATRPASRADTGPSEPTPESIDALMRAGDLAGAEQAARLVLAGAPDFARVHYYLGVTLYRTRRYEGAVEELRKAIAMRPVWGRAHYDLALALLRLDRLDEAEAELVLAEEQAHASHLPSIRAAQADLLVRTGQRDDARKLAEEAATIAGVTPALGRLLGELRREVGDLRGSASALRLAIEAAPEDPSLRWALGWTLALLKRDADAVDQYELADKLEADRAPAGLSWLVSYPKTGATWLRYMMATAMSLSLDADAPCETVDTGRIATLNPAWPRLGWTHDDAAIINEDGSPVDLRRLMLADHRRRYRGSRVVLLVRDPKDTLVSYFHHATRRSETPMELGSLGSFVRDPQLGLARVLRFLDVWSRATDAPDSLTVVSYEQLQADTPGTLARVLEALGVEGVSPEACARAAELGQADRMRAKEAAGTIEGMRVFSDDPNAAKVRSARVGSHADEMSPRDIAWCDKRIAAAMDSLAPPIRGALTPHA